ncbi:hypothetical protein CTAYLR_009622 [Chrysophaeum taylorii]|uniref:Pyruvate kinase n=1 Tax=Chrysophaeum taylorii TaxID=2483200 RepID=A0AAD7UJ91_9STRA|nr:hypothetical protein CTAYLR_009622 [Chrysophaeum taylorii]
MMDVDKKELKGLKPKFTDVSGYASLTGAALRKRTRIICTIGPSCWSVEMLGVLLEQGMNVARLNFSHGDHETHARTIARLKEALAKRPGMHCAVMLDTKGPEIRTGFFGPKLEGKKLELTAGQTLILTTDYTHKSDGTKLGITYEKLPQSVKPGNQILIADGSLVLEVESISGIEVACKVLNDAAIGERKNCNLPGVHVDLPVLQPKDIMDLQDFGVPQGVDYVAASFVQSASDVHFIRKILDQVGGQNVKIIPKIENQEGLDYFEEIVKASDAIMVARGDLGMEIPPEKVFRAQKMMISTCARLGKPVIVATQMLESMVSNPRPTRAECSDVANAVLDGADAVMLSGETAGGKFPKEAVAIMARTCVEAEEEFDFDTAYERELKREKKLHTLSLVESTTAAAVQAARTAAARAIIIFAHTGGTAMLFAKYKCSIPIIVVTAHAAVARYCKGLVAGSTVLLLPDHKRYGYQHESGEDEGVMVTEAVKFAASLGIVTCAEDPICALHAYRIGAVKNVAMRFFEAGSALNS